MKGHWAWRAAIKVCGFRPTGQICGLRRSGSRQDALLAGEAAESHASDEDLEILAAYRKAKKQGVGEKKEGGPPKKGGDRARGGGQTLNGFNRETGLRSKRYRRDSKYRLAPRFPRRNTPRGEGRPFSPGRARSQRPSFSSFSMETPVFPQKAESVGGCETRRKCEQPFVITADAGDAFMVSQDANLVCFRWLARRNCFLGRRGIPRRPAANPSQARFRFGDGRLGGVRRAADIPVGIAGNKGMYTARVPEGDTPELLRAGAAEAPGRQMDFARLAECIPTGPADAPEGESGGTLRSGRGRLPGGPIEDCVEMSSGIGLVFAIGP